VIRLLRLVSSAVSWAIRTPRRVVGVLAVPVLVAVALAAGPIRDRPAQPTGLATPTSPATPSGPSTATPAGPRSTLLPDTTAPVRPQPGVPSFRLSRDQQAAAVGYVVAANSHDARPGHDRAFTDSYARARPYVTARLYDQITSADPRRGDYEWRRWLAGKATVTVDVIATGVPDGAPAPTGTTAYVRVQFRQVVRPTAGAEAPTTTVDVLNMLVTRGSDGRWLVSRLLADV
jgi:hypothetical protein